MADLPLVAPSAPEAPRPAGTRAALTPLDIASFACELFAFVSLALWGFMSWPMPWNIVAGIVTPLAAIVLWGLFVSPRAVFIVHPFVRALVELLVYAAATITWWTGGDAMIGLIFAAVAVTVGVLAGRRRLA